MRQFHLRLGSNAEVKTPVYIASLILAAAVALSGYFGLRSERAKQVLKYDDAAERSS